MGFLEDLVKTIQEAADEAKRRQGQLPPQAQRPAHRQAPMSRMTRRAEPPNSQASARAAEAPAEPEVADLAAQARAAAPVRAALPVRAVASVAKPAMSRMARLMHQGDTLRTALILSELLQPPLAYRRHLLKNPRPWM